MRHGRESPVETRKPIVWGVSTGHVGKLACPAKAGASAVGFLVPRRIPRPMGEFLKNYILGALLMIWYLPRIVVAVLLMMFPGAIAAFLLNSLLPSATVLASIAGLVVSLLVTFKTRYGLAVQKVWPFDNWN